MEPNAKTDIALLRFVLGHNVGCHHFHPSGADQAIDRLEALVMRPTLYEAHGVVVAGPPGDTKGTGCLRCDMTQFIGDHDEGCSQLERLARIMRDTFLVNGAYLRCAGRERQLSF